MQGELYQGHVQQHVTLFVISGKLEPTKCPFTMNGQIPCGLFTYNYVQQFGCSLIQKNAYCGPIYRKVQK